MPKKKISITAIPSREQDVIALFNQLIAGGVIRGIQIMTTNERFFYDSLYRVTFEPPSENHVFNTQTNPLGVLKDIVEDHQDFVSEPKILEYKYSLDGLIEEIGTEEKDSNDIGLVVVWKTDEDFRGNYSITSLLDIDNLPLRQYHGVTHVMTNVTSGQKEMDLIVLEELIEYLNFPEETKNKQFEKYENFE